MTITQESILSDLENDRLAMPTLPEVALKVRDTIDDDDASIQDVAQIIETDAALSARIVQIGNSALYRGMSAAETVAQAAMRMGLDTVRNVATSLVMKQLFQATHPVVDSYLRKAWKTSTDVAAFSAVIAKTTDGVEPDSALLAGLTHSIGLSPLLVKAESDPELLNNSYKLEDMLFELYPIVGAEILKRWDFSEALCKVPAEHLDINRTGSNGEVDYADIVQVALIETMDPEMHHPLAGVDKSTVSSYHRLGMGDAVEVIDMSGGVIEVEEIKEMIL